MPTRALCLAVLMALPALSAWAQYKVVRPDGSVTYTDRPPTSETAARITPLSRSGAASAGAADASLPLELRQALTRYPVTLYATADCVPCDNGRRLLQQRGIPYNERRIASDEDAAALERAAGGRTVPALTVGAQQLRGFSESDWMAYLDAAGYPRESKLPRNWQTPVAVPMVERGTPATPARSAPPVDPRPDDLPANPVNPAGVRF